MTSYLQAPKAGAVLVSITLSHFFSCQQKVFHPLFKLFSVLKINMKHIMHRRKLSLVFTRQKEKKIKYVLETTRKWIAIVDVIYEEKFVL